MSSFMNEWMKRSIIRDKTNQPWSFFYKARGIYIIITKLSFSNQQNNQHIILQIDYIII